MKKSKLIIVLCLAILLLSGCGAANPAPTLESSPAMVEPAPVVTPDPTPEPAVPRPEITPEPSPDAPAELSNEAIEAAVAELFEEFTGFDWKATTIENYMSEHPDVSKKIENLSTKVIGTIEYERMVGARQFIKNYSSSSKSIDSFGLSAKTERAGLEKGGELSETEVKQFENAVIKQIEILKGQIRVLTERDMGNKNAADPDKINSYVAKTEYGFVSISPSDTYVDIKFYSLNHSTIKNMYPKAKKK